MALNQSKYRSIVLIGQAGTGKGTQAKKIADELGFEIFSMGDKAREYAAKDSALGQHIAAIHLTGWIPEWLASYLMTKAILEDYIDGGVVYESVARKPEEAQKFHEIHTAIKRPYVVVYLQAPENVLVDRMLKRQREGYDNPENIQKRFDAFKNETMLSIDYFNKQGVLSEINADQAVEQVFADIMKVLKG